MNEKRNLQINVKVSQKEKEALRKIASSESHKIGYRVSVVGLINKILTDYINNYDIEK